jgi:hypothetical protein
MRRIAPFTLAAAAAALALAPAAGAQTTGVPPVPIPGGLIGGAPEFQGGAATPKPVKGVRKQPRHPYMAPNGRSNSHNDAHQTDPYR